MRTFLTPRLLLLFAGLSTWAQNRAPIQDDIWREYDLYRGRFMQLAKAIPEDKYDWRPAAGVRSIKEVVVHLSLNNYMLLERMGRLAPEDLFAGVAAAGPERARTVFQKTVEYEKSLSGKDKVLRVADQAWAATTAALKETSAHDLNRTVMWGDRKTSVGGMQLRVVAHLHEHLGQLIAYARVIGITPPWSE